MEELLKALIAQYKSVAGATLRAKTGANIFLDTAPQDSSGMWLVLSMASNGMDWTMGTNRNYTEDFTVTFRLCSSSSATDCMTALPLLTALYDDQMLTMTGYRMLLFQRVREWPTRDFDSEGYVIFVDYHVLVGR